MDEESKNWFRLSKLIIDVGPNILRKYVVERAQACFFNYLENEWHVNVQAIYDANFVSLQWTSFWKELHNMDNVLQTTPKRLLVRWKKDLSKNSELSEHISTLNRWKNDIEKRLQTRAEPMLLSLLKQIEARINHLYVMPAILQKCTTEFFELCQRFRQDLVRKCKEHYDDFLSLCRQKVSTWMNLTRNTLKEKIIGLESERQKTQEKSNKELENFLQSLGEDMNHIFRSWKQESPCINDMKELKDLFNGMETKVNSIDRKRLQESCDTWHPDLENLFKRWLDKTDKFPNRHRLPVSSFVKDLKLFPSLSLLHVRYNLKELRPILKNMMSKKEMSKLFPNSGFPELRNCDTSLLFKVFKSGLVCPPMKDWHDDPPEYDQSLGADILRLKSYRNEIVGHIEKTKIDRCEFDVLWMSVQNVLCRLASGLGHRFESEIRTEVDKIKEASFDSNTEQEFQRILRWCRNDILDEFREIAKLNKCLNVLESVERIQRERGRARGIVEVIESGMEAIFGLAMNWLLGRG